MAIDIVVPTLGESITEGTVAAWLKQPGDAVGVDEPLVEFETDKATVEICAPKAGVLTEIRVAEGEDAAVGTVIGRIDDAAGAVTGKAVEAVSAAVAPAPPAATAVPTVKSGEPDLPRTLDPSEIARSGPDGRITLDDLLRFVGLAVVDLDRCGPAVRKLIADHGIDPSLIPASGREGRLTKGDVQKFLAGREADAADAAIEVSTAPSVEDPRVKRVRMTRMRRTIAARLKEAQNTAAILTTFNEVDMTAIRELRSLHRDAFEKRHGVKLGFTSFFVKACVAALKAFPVVNSEIDGVEIVYKEYYDLGMAVSTDDGLVVPVIRDCDEKTPAAIERSLVDLAQKARTGTLTTEEMSGGTFSITNGGVFGSLLSTPILNPPQSAILGLHKIEDRPVAVNDEVVIRPMMYLALSYDHRIIDGRDAVSFLVKVKEGLENPEQLSMNLEEV